MGDLGLAELFDQEKYASNFGIDCVQVLDTCANILKANEAPQGGEASQDEAAEEETNSNAFLCQQCQGGDKEKACYIVSFHVPEDGDGKIPKASMRHWVDLPKANNVRKPACNAAVLK